MDISATAYRILRYLNMHQSHLTIVDTMITPDLIFQEIYCGIRRQFNDALKGLVDKGLIQETKSDVSITSTGIDYLIKIERQNEDLVFEDIFEDFDYAVLKFLHVNNWRVKLEEFPAILMKEVSKKVTPRDDVNLLNYLHSKEKYIDFNVDGYKLNNDGIRYYKFLTDKKIAEKEAKTIPLVFGNNNVVGNSTTTTTNSNNVTTTTIEQKSSDKKWLRVIGEAIIKAIVNYYIPFLIGIAIGFLGGKSCNQTPLQNQIQNSTDSLRSIK